MLSQHHYAYEDRVNLLPSAHDLHSSRVLPSSVLKHFDYYDDPDAQYLVSAPTQAISQHDHGHPKHVVSDPT